ncbi:hypothetical protein LJ737_08435 [Hymenobacter sp. 15J16-1T3B]|uniref:hypothetical protein n=1 Tax=Hymenobacter sp. 15J16-1T3B TaxID=2886941 RepID=UPI001D10D047|nr:hypothetical protein [Hymenobacter sp. 15J16-1T3B]MCC3157263.1 hypothetical protein [Hymenobacter sp. 15J16-1T3B]
MRLRILLLGCLSLLLAHRGHAQEAHVPFFPTDYASFGPLRTMPLVLLLEDVPPFVAKVSAKKPELFATLRADIATFNEHMRQAGQFWTFSPQVQVRTPAQLDSLLADGQPRLVLKAGQADTYNDVCPAVFLNVHQKTPGKKNVHVETVLGCYYTTQSVLVRRFHDQFAASDLLNTLQQMQRYLLARAGGVSDQQYRQGLRAELAAGPAGRTKTLLLDQELLPADLTPARVAELYPYPVQVVPRAVIEEAVRAADARYLYARYVLLNKNHAYQLVDMADGRVVAFAKYQLGQGVSTPKVQEWVLEGLAQFGKGAD